ncbi:cGMP-dependent 3',5'-cyclic phosphodiesterase isoform X2 [Augochlora pura]
MSSLDTSMPYAEKILALLEEFCGLSYPQVQQMLNRFIQNATHTKVTFLVLLLDKSEEMVIHVIGEKVLERELRFPVVNNILYKAIQNKAPTTIDVTLVDEEIIRHIQCQCQCQCLMSSSFLMIPIKHPKQDYAAVVVSLIDNSNDKTTDKRVEIVQECFRFCLGFLLNSFTCYEEVRQKKQCQKLLAISRKLFSHLGEFPDLLREIMAEVRNLTNAERCSLFLLDPDQQDLVAKVFDGIAMKESVKEMRIPIGKGIAGHVATTGKLLNIRNAYEHPLFYRRIDEVTGFKTRNILCFPIRDEKGIVGVAQLCNKKDGLYFDVFDEEVATAFSIYCGLSIMHSIIYKKMKDARARNILSNEVMMYHMMVEESDVQALVNCDLKTDLEDFNEFHFSPRSVPYEDMPCYTIKMFNNLGLIKRWKLKLSTLARFILYVKKGYRDAPYHNWPHAFSVTHFGYLLIRNLHLISENYMTHLQALVFLVACLSHDIDHRGTNNSFQMMSSTVLASLYSSEGSVMERHHLAQTMCILNTEAHLRIAEMQYQMINNNDVRNDSKQRKLFFEMLMTCCDLSDQTKHWTVSKKTAECIYEEFFSQGDLEKSMGLCPTEMMDRERASIPDLQVQFISNIVIPLFTNLATLFPMLQPLVHVLKENRDLWEVSKAIFQKSERSGMKGIAILMDPSFEREVLQIYMQSHDELATDTIVKLKLKETESHIQDENEDELM